MSMKTVLITGSSGLVGSACAEAFHAAGWIVHGVDNNQRARFFGPGGDTTRTLAYLQSSLDLFHHHDFDIQSVAAWERFFGDVTPDAIVHCAGQPSHDLAAKLPREDFAINAVATHGLLELARAHCRDAPFVFLSTNKVYGDNPNRLPMRETFRRWNLDAPVNESLSIDGCAHSLFGVSKCAADLMVQEYGRAFGMPTCCLRAGCITGEHHAGVELHGFLNYLIRCVQTGKIYTVFGHAGKQVRDNIHASDVAAFALAFVERPRFAEVYNIGGGVHNSCSIIEAMDLAKDATGRQPSWSYVDQARRGDHICYYSDLSKIRAHYPSWDVRVSLHAIVERIAHDTITLHPRVPAA